MKLSLGLGFHRGGSGPKLALAANGDGTMTISIPESDATDGFGPSFDVEWAEGGTDPWTTVTLNLSAGVYSNTIDPTDGVSVTVRHSTIPGTSATNDTTPAIAGVPDQTPAYGDSETTVDLSVYATGTNLVYSISDEVDWLEISGTDLVITPPAFGEAVNENPTVTVRNTVGSATDSFNITVAELVPVDPPEAIDDLAVTVIANSQITLGWTAPADGGAAISDYVVEYKLSSSGTWLTFSDGTSTDTSVIVTGLTNSSSYDFRVSAVNSAGTGPSSNEVSGTPVSFTKDGIVFAGQSNMVGQGTDNPTYNNSLENYALDDVVKAYDDPFLNTSGTVYGTVFNNSSPGTGSAGYVADFVMSNTGTQVVTIPAAKGGTGFAAGNWDDGSDHEQGLIERINKAKAFSNIDCVVWWQGEDDADEGTTAAQYEAYMDTLKANVAAQTGIDLKWVVVKLHAWNAGISGISESAWNEIQDGQQNFADNNADVYLVDASAIEGNTSDRVHLDDEGYLAAAALIGKSVLQNVYSVSNPDMLYLNTPAYYYNIDRDSITTSGTDITAITPSLDGGGSQNVGTTGRYPQDATGLNGLRVLDMDTNGYGFVRHEFNAGDNQTVFLAGTIPSQNAGNYVFALGTTANGSSTRAITLNGADNLFIRNDAGGAESLKNPIDDPQDFVMCLRWNSTTSLEIWFNDNVAILDIDPEDITSLDRAWIGAIDSSGSSLSAVGSLQIAVAAQYERTLSDQEVQCGLDYLSGLTGVQISPATLTSINSDGWRGVHSDIGAFDDTETVTVTRQGYDSSGNTTTVDDEVITQVRTREPYPNGTTTTTNVVALSEYIYSNDTIAGTTNNSTRDYPKPICDWVNPEWQVTDTTLTLRLFVAHAYGRNGTPVAAVELSLTDSTNTEAQMVSSLTSYTMPLSGITVPVYEYTFDLASSSLNTGQITADATIYPHVGDVFTISTDGDAYPNSEYCSTQPHIYGDFERFAYVDQSSDGVGAATSTTLAGAQSTPYNDFDTATAALASDNGDLSLCKLVLKDNQTHAYTRYDNRSLGSEPFYIEGEGTGSGRAIMSVGGSAADRSSKLGVIENVQLKASANSTTLLGDRATDATWTTILKGCTIDPNGFTEGDGVREVGRFFLYDTEGFYINGGSAFSAGNRFRFIRTYGCKNIGNSSVTHAIGNDNSWTGLGADGAGYLLDSDRATDDRAAARGALIAYNIIESDGGQNNVKMDAVRPDATGVALVGNVGAITGATSDDNLEFMGSSPTDVNDVRPLENVVHMYNTWAGGSSNGPRDNKADQDVGDLYWQVFWKGNIVGTSAKSGDYDNNSPYVADGSKTRNWAQRFATAWSDSVVYNPGVAGYAYNQNNGDYLGQNMLHTVGAALFPGFTEDASATGDNDHVSGDYRLVDDSGTTNLIANVPTLPSKSIAYTVDLQGTTIPTDGSAITGGLQDTS